MHSIHYSGIVDYLLGLSTRIVVAIDISIRTNFSPFAN